jgi:hypothetical protein
MGPGKTGSRRRSGPALAASAALHALALAVLVASVRPPPRLPEPPPVQVQLLELNPRDPVFQPLPASVPALRPRPAEAPPSDAPPPPPQLRGTVERGPPVQSPPTPERGERPPYLSFYQDALKGCEKEALLLMPEAEAERCRARIAAAALAAPRGFRRGGPPVEALSGLAEARRAALDAEVERRARAGRPMGNPFVPCDGPGANLGAGCLAPKEED